MLTLSNNTKQHTGETARALQAAEGYLFFSLYRDGLAEHAAWDPKR